MTRRKTYAVSKRVVDLANEILDDEEWFDRLPPHTKDHLSRPNHNQAQAERAIQLAGMILAEFAAGPMAPGGKGPSKQ